MTIRIQFDPPTIFEPAFRGTPRRAPGEAKLTLIRAAFLRWKQRRLLETLDDRMLRDIGVSRSEAIAEASKPCWRR